MNKKCRKKVKARRDDKPAWATPTPGNLEKSLAILRELGHNVFKNEHESYTCVDCGVHCFPDNGHMLGLFGPQNDMTWPPMVHFANQHGTKLMWIAHLDQPGDFVWCEATNKGNVYHKVPQDFHKCIGK